MEADQKRKRKEGGREIKKKGGEEKIKMEYEKRGFLVAQNRKESSCSAGDLGLIPWSGRSPWRRKWQPTRVLLFGEFHVQRSLGVTVHEFSKSQIRLSD